MLNYGAEGIRILKIGIIGAGTMGRGIAQVFAQSKRYEVLLCSSNIDSAGLGLKKIEMDLKKKVSRGRLEVELAKSILAKIKIGVLEDCKECDMIVETIPEDLKKKKKLFYQLQEICKEDCIFATNTSSLSITEIGEGISQSVIGMHFFNPAPIMKLVEVTPGVSASKKTVERVIEISEEIGKCPIVVKERAGFIVNRLLIPMINEAIRLYAEGIASVENIDNAMKLGANHPMGPLQLGDIIGLDVCLAIMEVLQKENGEPKYSPHPLLRKMVNEGLLGKKSGKGFYIYNV